MDKLSFLEALLAIPSPSGSEDAVACYLVEQMAALGFRSYRDGAGNAVGRIGDPQAGRKIVLLGHMDTVSGHVPLRREGGRIYGRGAVDAKGPLAAFVLAAAQAAPQVEDLELVGIGAVEEESRSRGAHYLAETMEAPDFAIIGEPSGWQGITLGYKGTLVVEYHLARSRGHTASAWAAPAQDAVAFWNRLMAHAEEVNGGAEGRFDTLAPALRAIHSFGDGLQEGVEMTLALRLPPGCDVEDLKGRLDSWREGAALTFPYYEPAFRADKHNPLVRSLLRAIRAEGGRPRFKLKTGTADMNVVGPAWGCPIVAYGPGDSHLDHTPNEHIEIEEFLRGVGVLTRALEFLGGQR